MNKTLLQLLAAASLSVSHVLHALPRTALPPVPEAGQLALWRFNEPSGNIANVIVSVNPQPVESWSGLALRMAGAETRLLALPETDAEGQSYLNRDAGAIRFWFAPEWSSVNEEEPGNGPGSEAVLLERGAWSGSNAQGW